MHPASENQEAPHFVKCRMVGKKAWAFLSSGGRMSRLRIHAVRFASKERAENLIAENAADNPEWEFKVVSCAALSKEQGDA